MSADDITQILDELAGSDPDAEQAAWDALYPEMLRLARHERRRWDGNWTLETGALVNEAYLKLFGGQPRDFEGRRHFFRLVSRVTRQILVNYAEARRSRKRGGDAPTPVPLEEAPGVAMTPSMTPGVADEVVALNEALEEFRRVDPRAVEVVELRFFAGLTHEEIARTLEMSLATVGRDWAVARAWLKRALAADRAGTMLDEPGD